MNPDSFSQLFCAVREKLGNTESCHDFDHTLRVLANARKIAAEIPEANLFIVEAAAAVHDFARPEETASKGKIDHAVCGAELAKSLLLSCGYTLEETQWIADCVRTHRFRGKHAPQSPEAQIVYDADKLDALGAVGIGRAFLFAGRQNARLHNRRAEALQNAEYSREDTAYREYLVKLSRLPGRMLTEPGKRLAWERAAFMKQFFDELNAECYGGPTMTDPTDPDGVPAGTPRP